MRFSVVGLISLISVCACTETVVPDGVAPVSLGETSAAMLREYDLATETRLLTRACIDAELHGTARLAALPKQGYTPLNDMGRLFYIKQAPKQKTLEWIRSIAVTKPNDRLSCTIHVRPYTQGSAVLALAQAELLRSGFHMTSVKGAFGRDVPRFEKDGAVIVVSGYAPGYGVKESTGAEISFSRTDN